MSPEERQLLNGLFERIKSASNSPRDEEAQTFITDQVKALPAAPYLLAQTVIVQEQALEGANARIKQLEARLAEATSKGSGSFLSGIFGQRPADPPPRATGPWGQNMVGYPPPQPQAYAPDASGGSFLRGALGTAAGVAGGAASAAGATRPGPAAERPRPPVRRQEEEGRSEQEAVTRRLRARLNSRDSGAKPERNGLPSSGR